MIIAFGVAIIFIIIAVIKNRKDEYVKQASFAILVLAILNYFMLLSTGEDGNGHAIYMSYFLIPFDSRDMMFNGSIILALISLTTYLLTEARR